MEERTTTVVRIIPATKKDPLRSLLKTWAGVDSNHRTLSGTDLQSVAFSHSATYPYSNFKKLPLTRLELVTSPLPRECSTSEPQGLASSELFNYQRKKPVIGIEPTTYGLQNRCSTVELYRQQN